MQDVIWVLAGFFGAACRAANVQRDLKPFSFVRVLPSPPRSRDADGKEPSHGHYIRPPDHRKIPIQRSRSTPTNYWAVKHISVGGG